MPSQGPNSPDNGTGTSWTNPANVTANDDTPATFTVPASGNSERHFSADFDFAIPGTATPVGIKARLRHKGEVADVIQDAEVYLSKNGSASVGDNHAEGNTIGDTYAYREYGGPTDLWGTTWSPSELNAVTLSVIVRYTNNDSVDRVVSLDHVDLEVTYEDIVNGSGTSIGCARCSGAGIPAIMGTGTSKGAAVNNAPLVTLPAAVKGTAIGAARDTGTANAIGPITGKSVGAARPSAAMVGVLNVFKGTAIGAARNSAVVVGSGVLHGEAIGCGRAINTGFTGWRPATGVSVGAAVNWGSGYMGLYGTGTSKGAARASAGVQAVGVITASSVGAAVPRGAATLALVLSGVSVGSSPARASAALARPISGASVGVSVTSGGGILVGVLSGRSTGAARASGSIQAIGVVKGTAIGAAVPYARLGPLANFVVVAMAAYNPGVVLDSHQL